MENFIAFIEVFAVISVAIGAAGRYLRVNKLWKRRHEPAVAESISLVEKSIWLFSGLPFLIKLAFIDKNISPGANQAFFLMESVFIILIGMGLWVKGNRKFSFIKLIKNAFLLEGRESTHLVKELMRPKGAEQIIEILEKVAAIDNEVAEEEVQLIKEFAARWKIPVPDIQAGPTTGTTNLLDLRASVEKYLRLSPPPKQAAQLTDLIELLIQADSKVTAEEDLIRKETTGLLNAYAGEHDENAVMFDVVLVPQNDRQIDAILVLFPDVTKQEYRGGTVFLAGRYYSKEYAEAICLKYENMGVFAVSAVG